MFLVMGYTLNKQVNNFNLPSPTQTQSQMSVQLKISNFYGIACHKQFQTYLYWTFFLFKKIKISSCVLLLSSNNTIQHIY